jgi:HAD superfamily hydrolase (TIGR01509 family)
MRELLRSDLVPMPGLERIVADFRGRLDLAVCTGAQREFLDIVIDGLGLRRDFKVLQSSDGIEKGKPDPGIYLETCRKLGRAPSDCVVLEDSENGVLAGRRAGCLVIAVPSEYTAGHDVSPAHVIVNDLNEAADFISARLRPRG